MPTTLYLVRHAQSQPLESVRDEEWALSPRGREQARSMVAVLRAFGVQRIYTSPFRRCQETLHPLAEATGLELVIHPGLRERSLGSQWIRDFREVWQRSWTDFSFAVEGGESSWVCRARIFEAAEEITRVHPHETIVLGSHGNAIGLFLNYVDPSAGVTEASALRTPEIIKVLHDGSRFRWDRSFRAGETFESIATDFRLTPGIVA